MDDCAVITNRRPDIMRTIIISMGTPSLNDFPRLFISLNYLTVPVVPSCVADRVLAILVPHNGSSSFHNGLTGRDVATRSNDRDYPLKTLVLVRVVLHLKFEKLEKVI